MYEDFKFYAVVNGQFYEVGSIKVDKPYSRALVTLEEFKPFTVLTHGGPAPDNSAWIPLDDLRVFNRRTMEITKVKSAVDTEKLRLAHYSTVAHESVHAPTVTPIEAV